MARGYFECCHYCKKPKRYPGCQDHCPEYAAAKVKHDAEMEARHKQRNLQTELYNQRSEGVHRAMKHRRKKGVQYE